MARIKTDERSGLLSIGRAVERLKKAYPSLSISKVRYLEDEGLIKFTRTKGGYRLFTEEDVERLAEILRLQKEDFLPLAVIKARMAQWRPGLSHKTDREAESGTATAQVNDGPLSLDELRHQTGIGTEAVRALETFGLVKVVEYEKGLGVEHDDVEVLTAFSKLLKFGIEPRHLRMYENLAQRESVLFQQILTPQVRQKSRDQREKSLADLKELLALTEEMRRSILKKSLKEAGLL